LADYIPPAIADTADSVLERFAPLIDDARILALQVRWRYKKGIVTNLHYFNPLKALWQDDVRALLAAYGQNRLVDLTVSSIKKEPDAEPS
jgi:hypothetical protein